MRRRKDKTRRRRRAFLSHRPERELSDSIKREKHTDAKEIEKETNAQWNGQRTDKQWLNGVMKIKGLTEWRKMDGKKTGSLGIGNIRGESVYMMVTEKRERRLGNN